MPPDEPPTLPISMLFSAHHFLAVLGLALPLVAPLDRAPAHEQDPSAFLEEAMEEANRETQFPGMAVALIENGELVATAVSGHRSVDGKTPIEMDDKFHVGSVTKSITATMIGRLVEQGKMDWDMTLGESLPGIEVPKAYADCTLRDVLHHRSGLPPYTLLDEEIAARLQAYTGNETEIRKQFVADLLQEKRGTQGVFAYSNAGYSVAGLMAELATQKTWRELVQAEVFTPLRMTSAGFGWPATTPGAEQPLGHWGESGGPFQIADPSEYNVGPSIAPAGNVHSSVKDLALYALAHMQGLQGLDGILKADTFATLHTPSEFPGGMSYACGWRVVKHGMEDETHAHNGSAGTFFAMVEIYPLQDRAMVILINAADMRETAVKQLLDAGAQRFAAMIEDE